MRNSSTVGYWGVDESLRLRPVLACYRARRSIGVNVVAKPECLCGITRRLYRLRIRKVMLVSEMEPAVKATLSIVWVTIRGLTQPHQ